MAIENMREIHKGDSTAVTQYINAPGANARRILEASSSDMACNEWNGVDICDPWRKFTEDEWFTKLGDRGQELIRAKRRSSPGRGHGGHG